MIQWVMRFYELNCGRPAGDYDAAARRKGVEPDFSYSDKTVIPKVFLLAPTKQSEKPPAASGAEKPASSSSVAKKEPSTATATVVNRVEKEQLVKKQATTIVSKAKADTPLEKLEKVKRILTSALEISDASKLAEIARILGVKCKQINRIRLIHSLIPFRSN